MFIFDKAKSAHPRNRACSGGFAHPIGIGCPNSPGLTSAKSLEEFRDVIILLIKTKLFAALTMVTETKCLLSDSRYDVTSGSQNIGVVCLACVFCLSFLFFFYHS